MSKAKKKKVSAESSEGIYAPGANSWYDGDDVRRFVDAVVDAAKRTEVPVRVEASQDVGELRLVVDLSRFLKATTRMAFAEALMPLQELGAKFDGNGNLVTKDQ